MAEAETMKQLVIAYPEGLAQTLEIPDGELGAEVAFLAAAKLYELGRLSASWAARLAGLGKLDFLARLSSVGISAISLRDEDITVEIAAAREVAGSAAADSDDRADLQLQWALIEAALTAQVRPLGARAPDPDPPPLFIDGVPLSETIIAERR